MKNVILFFGSFDPLHKGHISIIENSIKKVHASYLYLGLNKSSKKGKLTNYYHRYSMLKEYAKTRSDCEVLKFSFDYTNLEKTYKRIFSMLEEETNYYILIGQDQLASLNKWHDFDLLISKFSFIIAKRGDSTIDNLYLNNPKYIFIDHNYKNISSTLIKQGKYNFTNDLIKSYILEHNLYLKLQIKPYLNKKRYEHCLSVAKTALFINKSAKLGLNKYQVEKACLLHDIAKDLNKELAFSIINDYYPQYINEDKSIIHQYIGEYIAKENFFVNDINVLNAIKFHTSGRSNMSILEKLVYVSDKIEPNRNYNTLPLINACCNNFEEGFIKVLRKNKEYLESKNITVTNKDALACFNYYLN